MSVIWTFGDSFTFGDGCRSDKGIIDGDLKYYNKYFKDGNTIWPNILGKVTGYSVRNLSKSGASNDFIIDSIMNVFNLINQKDIVIISKTFFERFDIPKLNDNTFDTIYAETLYGIDVCLNSEKSPKNKIQKETILNFGLLFASNPIIKKRQDIRFNFLKTILEKKVEKVFIWDVDSELRKSIETIGEHTNYEYNDYHFSFNGHSQFANILYKSLFETKTLI
jgi:hypothetical protein